MSLNIDFAEIVKKKTQKNFNFWTIFYNSLTMNIIFTTLLSFSSIK